MKLESGSIRQEDLEYEQTQAKLKAEAKQKQEELIKKRKQQYQKKLINDRIELLKERQGVAENETPPESEIHIEKPKGKKAVENFFYHYKGAVMVVIALICVAGFMIYSSVTKVNADMNVLLLVPGEGATAKLEALLKTYTEDENNDGKTIVDIVSLPLKEDSTVGTVEMATQTKLIAEFQAGSDMLVISNEIIDERFSESDVFEDFTSEYPNNPNVTKKGLLLSTDKIKSALKWEDMPDNVYLSVRKPIKLSGANQKQMEAQYQSAKKVFAKMVNEYGK